MKNRYYENHSDAYNILSFESTSLAKQVIPASYFYYAVGYAGGSAFNITVSWAAGYALNDATTPTACVQVCGDGLRVGTEVCDDGNTTIGWYNSCSQILNQWICTGGSSTSADKCSECPSGQTNNGEHTKCIEQNQADSFMDSLAAIGMISLAVGSSSSGLHSLINSSASQGTFSMFNSVQLLLLLPLIGAYLPEKVISYITSMNFSLLNFNFLRWNETPEIESETSKMDIYQKDEYLKDIGLESGNALINIMTLMGISLIIPVIHIIFILSYCLIKKKYNQKKCWHRFILSIYKRLTFGYYIRYFYEIYLLAMLVALTSLYHLNKYDANNYVSLGISVLLVIFWALLILLGSYQSFKANSKKKYSKMRYFVEFFNGVKV